MEERRFSSSALLGCSFVFSRSEKGEAASLLLEAAADFEAGAAAVIEEAAAGLEAETA